MKNTNTPPPFHLDQQVELLEYLNVLIRYKYTIFIFATLAAIAVFAFSMTIENKYSTQALVAININEEPGGVTPDQYSTSYTLGLLENDFILDSTQSRTNETKRMLATLRSFSFNTQFIKEQNLLPYLFRDQWDETNQTWKDGFKPDMRWANQMFVGMRSFDHSEETGLLKIYFTTRDPDLSAKLANAIIGSFNNYAKQKQVRLIEERQAYLQGRLQEIDNIQLHRSIYRMIESQIGAESLIYARKDYPLEVIEPALPPLFKSSPNRKQYATMAFVGFLVLGMMVAMGSVLFRKIKEGLSQYQVTVNDSIEKALNETEDSKNSLSPSDEWIEK